MNLRNRSRLAGLDEWEKRCVGKKSRYFMLLAFQGIDASTHMRTYISGFGNQIGEFDSF